MFETLVSDKNIEINNGISNCLAKRYDTLFVDGDTMVGDSHFVTRTLAEALTEMTFESHPLGQITFYFGRTDFDKDSAGLNLYHWSTTQANASHALYDFTRTGTFNPLGLEQFRPTIYGYGTSPPVVIDGQTLIEFYEEDRFVSSIPAPTGYETNPFGLQIPYWGSPGNNSVPWDIDFYGVEINKKKNGNIVYDLASETTYSQFLFSLLADAIFEVRLGDVDFYWVPLYKHIPFTETLITKQYYRKPRITYFPVLRTIFWDSETNGFFSIETESPLYNIPNLSRTGKLNKTPQSSSNFLLQDNTGLRSNNEKSYIQKSYDFIDGSFFPNNIIQNDIYLNYDYHIKDVVVDSGSIRIDDYNITGYTAINYGDNITYSVTSGSEIFDLFPKRDDETAIYVNSGDFNVVISGSIIRNKDSYMTNGILDLDKIYSSNGPFLVDGVFANISSRETFNFCKNIGFYYDDPPFNERIYFLNDESDSVNDMVQAPFGYYDFDVTLQTISGNVYYSDNSDTFDGGGIGATTGSGTQNLTNSSQFEGGSSKKVLYFNASGTISTCNIDAYQGNRKFVVGVENGQEIWRTNHLSPLFSLPYYNSGVLEQPADTFQTINCGVADGNRLFIGGNTVGVFPKLTINSPDEYNEKTSKYNEKIQNCL